MKTELLNVKGAIVDRYGRLKTRFVSLLLDGYAVLDADTVVVLRDVGDGRFSVVSVRIHGIDSPEIHSRNKLEKEVGLLVTDVARKWCALAHRDGLEIEELPGGKYRGRCMGRLWNVNTAETLDEYLLASKLVLPYDGGTKAAWSDRKLRQIKRAAAKCLSELEDYVPDHAWVLPAIDNFVERHSA